MVNVSRKYLDKTLKAEAWQKLTNEMDGNKDPETIFKKFFTPKEIIMVEKRLAILVMLDKGYGYLDIRRTLDVSPGTVSFIRQGFKINKRPIRKSSRSIARDRGNKIGRTSPRYKGSRGFGSSER